MSDPNSLDGGRNARGQFARGVSGNRKGRPRKSGDKHLDSADDFGEPVNPRLSDRMREMHRDGWSSALTMIGTVRDKRTSHTYQAGGSLSYQQIAQLRETDDIVAKALEAESAECFREGYEIVIADEGSFDDLKEDLEEAMEELGIDEALEEAWNLKNAFGGSAILLGADDGGALDEPLDEEKVRKFDWLHVLEPIEIEPASYYDDIEGPNYGKPEYFRLTGAKPQTPNYAIEKKTKKQRQAELASNAGTLIHASRLIIFQGIRASKYYYSLSDISPFWGISTIPRFYDAVRDYEVAFAAAGIIATDFSQPVITIDGLKNQVGKNENTLRDRFIALEMGRSIARAIVLDSKEKYERQTTQLTGIPDLLDRLAQRCSAAVKQPLSVLIGYSQATLGAPDEDELKQWYNQCRSTQRRKFRRPLLRVIKMKARTMRQRKLPKKIDVEFCELEHMTLAQRVEAESTQARTDSMVIKAGMATPDELRKARYKGGYSFKTSIDEKKKAPGFLAPLPTGVLPGSMPAAGVINSLEAGAKGAAKPGAPAAAGPNAHTVGGYARRNPTAPALGANPKQGGDNTNLPRGDAMPLYTAQNELDYQKGRLAKAKADSAVAGHLKALIALTEEEAAACAAGTCGPDCNYDHVNTDGIATYDDLAAAAQPIRTEFQGFPILIENPRGSYRTWVDSTGETGQTKMNYDYGEIEGSFGADGDPVDVYLGPNPESPWVFVMHQMCKATDFTTFDEDKVMLGFDSANHARDAYLSQYNDDRFFGGMSQMPVDAFRRQVSAMTGRAITVVPQ